MEKGFLLDETNDVVIQNNEIKMISGDELARQTIQSVLSTNKGEWFLDEDEGINFQTIFAKNVAEEEVKSEIFNGLLQLDDTFIMETFSMNLIAEKRLLTVEFTASNSTGQTVQGSNSWNM